MTLPVTPWDTFYRYFERSWHQGEHVSYIGPTGSGKTTLALAILPIRRYCVALATKPKDATMDALARSGWRKTETWPPPRRVGASNERVILWPKINDLSLATRGNQQHQIQRALEDCYGAGGWTVFADELHYLVKQLGLGPLLEAYWTQGRSIGLTLVGGTQRPAHIPLMAYDQATHLFFYRDNDETNLRRIGGLGGLNSRDIRATVAVLPKHHALYLNTRTGETAVTKAPAPTTRKR